MGRGAVGLKYKLKKHLCREESLQFSRRSTMSTENGSSNLEANNFLPDDDIVLVVPKIDEESALDVGGSEDVPP